MNTRNMKIPKLLHKLLSFYALLERDAFQIVFIFNEVMIVQSGRREDFTVYDSPTTKDLHSNQQRFILLCEDSKTFLTFAG